MADAPRRIQLSRAKGWRMPAKTMHVARPGFWGNPFPHADRAIAARTFRVWLTGAMRTCPMLGIRPVRTNLRGLRKVMLQQLPDLRGKNLACWCRLDQPCHADVLLELANAPLRCEAVDA
jgi:hypothetical protein